MSREDRREAFLRSATELINTGGIGAFSFEALAEDLGVAKTLPYAYFETKDEVLVALFERVVGAADAAVAAVVAAGGPVESVVRDSLEVWFDKVRSEGRLLAGLLDGRAVPGLAPTIRQRDKQSHKLWHDYVVAELGATDAAAHVLASMLNRSATGLVELWVERHANRGALVDAFVAAAVAAADALRS